MSEKRYYWLKLQEDFFSSLRIKKLRKIAGGDTYTIIYLKMQLLAIRNGGILKYCGIEKSFAEELALDMDEDIENVSVTLQYLLSCGLIETSDNIEFLLPFAAMNTGSEGSGAKRVREFRERQKALQSNADVTAVKQIGNGEIEKEIEIEIDKEKEIDTPCSPPKKATAKKGKNLEEKVHFSEFVSMTNTEHQKLLNDYGPEDTARLIEILNNYKGSTGKVYKSDYMAILSWVRDRLEEEKARDRKGRTATDQGGCPERDYVVHYDNEGYF